MYGFLKYHFCALYIKIVFKYVVHLLPFKQCLLVICCQPSGLELIIWGKFLGPSGNMSNLSCCLISNACFD